MKQIKMKRKSPLKTHYYFDVIRKNSLFFFIYKLHLNGIGVQYRKKNR